MQPTTDQCVIISRKPIGWGLYIALIRLENAFLKVLKRWISRSSGPESQPSRCQASATESSLWSFARGLCTSLLHGVDAESSIIQGITLSC